MSQLREGRYRFLNVKSGNLYLGVQSNMELENGGSLALEPDDGLSGSGVLGSSQVWYLVQYGTEGEYMMINQRTGYLACIRSRSTKDGATAIQYYTQLTEKNGSFQLWTFHDYNGNLLICNVNSQMYIGPHDRDATNDNYIIQWENQTDQDNYQEWIAKPVTLEEQPTETSEGEIIVDFTPPSGEGGRATVEYCDSEGAPLQSNPAVAYGDSQTFTLKLGNKNGWYFYAISFWGSVISPNGCGGVNESTVSEVFLDGWYQGDVTLTLNDQTYEYISNIYVNRDSSDNEVQEITFTVNNNNPADTEAGKIGLEVIFTNSIDRSEQTTFLASRDPEIELLKKPTPPSEAGT